MRENKILFYSLLLCVFSANSLPIDQNIFTNNLKNSSKNSQLDQVTSNLNQSTNSIQRLISFKDVLLKRNKRQCCMSHPPFVVAPSNPEFFDPCFSPFGCSNCVNNDDEDDSDKKIRIEIKCLNDKPKPPKIVLLPPPNPFLPFPSPPLLIPSNIFSIPLAPLPQSFSLPEPSSLNEPVLVRPPIPPIATAPGLPSHILIKTLSPSPVLHPWPSPAFLPSPSSPLTDLPLPDLKCVASCMPNCSPQCIQNILPNCPAQCMPSCFSTCLQANQVVSLVPPSNSLPSPPAVLPNSKPFLYSLPFLPTQPFLPQFPPPGSSKILFPDKPYGSLLPQSPPPLPPSQPSLPPPQSPLPLPSINPLPSPNSQVVCLSPCDNNVPFNQPPPWWLKKPGPLSPLLPRESVILPPPIPVDATIPSDPFPPLLPHGSIIVEPKKLPCGCTDDDCLKIILSVKYGNSICEPNFPKIVNIPNGFGPFPPLPLQPQIQLPISSPLPPPIPSLPPPPPPLPLPPPLPAPIPVARPPCIPLCQPACNLDCMKAYLITVQAVPQCNLEQCPPKSPVALSPQFVSVNSPLVPPLHPLSPFSRPSIALSPSIHSSFSSLFYQPTSIPLPPSLPGSYPTSLLSVSHSIPILSPFVKKNLIHKNFIHPPPMPLQPPQPSTISQIIQTQASPIPISSFSPTYFKPSLECAPGYFQCTPNNCCRKRREDDIAENKEDANRFFKVEQNNENELKLKHKHKSRSNKIKLRNKLINENKNSQQET